MPRPARWLLVLVLMAAVAAGLLSLGAEEPQTSGLRADGREADAAAPTLEGLDPATASIQQQRHADAAEEQLLARRGEGQGGFLVESLLEGTCCITGRILGADREPVAGAEIVGLVADDDKAIDDADPDGRFTLEFSAEDAVVRLLATAPGHVARALPWRRLRDREHVDVGTIVLDRGLSLAGQVVDQDGAPWAGGIWLDLDDDPVPAWWVALRSVRVGRAARRALDDEGRFVFDGLSAGHYRLRVWCGGDEDAAILEQVAAGRTDLRVVVRRPPVEEPWPVTLVLPAAFEDAASRDPIVSFRGGSVLQRSAREGSRMFYTCKGPGPVDVTISFQSAYPPVVLTGIRPPGGTFEVPGRAGRTLRGRLVGVPPARLLEANVLGGAFLHADGVMRPEHSPGADPEEPLVFGTATPDVDGRFAFTGLPPGVLRIRLRAHAFDLADGPVDVSSEAEGLELRATELPRLEVEFRVPEGVQVEFLRYELAVLGPWGNKTVDLADFDPQIYGWTRSLQLARSTDRHVLHVRAGGAPALAPLRLDVPPGARRLVAAFTQTPELRGRVTDPEGRGLARAVVWVVPEGSLLAASTFLPVPESERDAACAPSTRAGLDGQYRLALPAEGRWRVFAGAEGYALAEMPPLATGARACDLVMTPAFRITGRVRGPAGDVLDRYVVTAWPRAGGAGLQSFVDDSGFFEIGRLAPGPYTLSVHPSWAEGAEVFEGQATVPSVPAGARGVEVVLEPSLTARLELVDAQGAPVTGAQVWLRGSQREERAWNRASDPVFRVAGLAPGRYRFDVDIAGKPPLAVEVEAGQTARLVVP